MMEILGKNEPLFPAVPDADYKDISYVSNPRDEHIIRRVRKEDILPLMMQRSLSWMLHNLIGKGLDGNKISGTVESNLSEIMTMVREQIIWGTFSFSGRPKKLFEKGQVRRLTTTNDAKAFQELYLTGLADEPELFGGSYEDEEPKSVEEVGQFLQENYVVGVSHSYGFEEKPKMHKLITMGAIVRKGGHQKHIAEAGKLYTRKGHRLRGLGDSVKEHLLEYALKEEGLSQVSIIVTATNKHVIDWYKRLGFTQGQLMPHQAIVNGTSFDWVPMYFDLETYREKVQKKKPENQ